MAHLAACRAWMEGEELMLQQCQEKYFYKALGEGAHLPMAGGHPRPLRSSASLVLIAWSWLAVDPLGKEALERRW